MSTGSEPAITLVVGGDVCPVFRAEGLFQRGDGAAIFSDLLPELELADLSIVNLECPLIRSPSPVDRPGPLLGASAACIRGIAGSGIQVLSLANNHVLDHGEQGLLSTLETCAQSGVGVFGAGRDVAEASRIVVREVKGVRIGLLGLAQHEFSSAGPSTPGANPLELVRTLRTLRGAQGAWDFLVVLLHAGTEGYPYPSPRLVELCRTLVELGAGIVVCQHSHCPGCYESYLGSLIVYGQGNLVFDWVPNPGGPWNQGFLVKACIRGTRLAGFELVPHAQHAARAGTRLMPQAEGAQFIESIEARSRTIAEDGAVERLWRERCAGVAATYYQLLLGNRRHHRLIRAMCERLGIRWRPMGRGRRMLLGNLIRCEDHREALEAILLGSADEGPPRANR